MKRIIITMAVMLAITGCAGKRYDSATKISSETTITQDSAAPITFEAPVVPMAGQAVKQAVGVARSLNGRKLVEVKFIHRDGAYSILESVETGERFKVKGNWGAEGDLFKLER